MITSKKKFAQKLHSLLAQKNMTQSDLARAIWGQTAMTNGRLAARNRDRISNYLRGTSWPTPKNLDALAKALGVNREELAPHVKPSEADETGFSMVETEPGKMQVRMNKVLSNDVAVKIAALVGAEIYP